MKKPVHCESCEEYVRPGYCDDCDRLNAEVEEHEERCSPKGGCFCATQVAR